MTPTSSGEIPAQENILQKYKERMERLSQQNRVIKICTDAGFLKTVEVGQYIMTKDTDEFSQITEPMTCREYTLPRDEKSTDPKGCIRGNTKVVPVLEVTTRYLQGKHGVEIRIESVNKDNSHSWVRISHCVNKLVTDWSTKSTTTTSRKPLRCSSKNSRWKRMYLRLQADPKAKAKPRGSSTTCSSSRTVLILERTWIDIEPGAQFHQAYPVSKRMNTLLRHGELPREEDVTIEFWRLKDDFRNRFEHPQYWSDDVWKNKMTGGRGNNKRFQYWTDPSGQEILDLRAPQGHSRSNSIDFTLQDNVLIPNNFFEYIYHIGCAISLHSMTNSGLIAGGQNLNRQTVFFTVVNPMQRSKRAWFDKTTSCILQEKRENASRHGVLGRHKSLLSG